MSPEIGWDVPEALLLLRGKIDPYLWEQGQELFRRGGVEDFAIQADGTLQIRVLDPRDSRAFHVMVQRRGSGEIIARCPCPYRLRGYCRHQVVALEYLRAVSEGEIAAEEDERAKGARSKTGPKAAAGEAAAAGSGVEGSVLYRLLDGGLPVSTRPDGSLLRVVLRSLGSGRTPHRVSLQLYTGTGWTELRSAETERWIDRGGRGPHARDALFVACLADENAIRSEIDSDGLARILAAAAGNESLVDATGRPVEVSLEPWRLEARLVRSGEKGIGVELRCASGGESCPFDEVSVLPSVPAWIQLSSGAFHPLLAAAPGPVIEELQEEDLSEIPTAELDRFLQEGVDRLERLCRGAFETEPGLIREVEGVDGARVRLDGSPARLAGRLELSYGGQWVPAPESPEPWSVESAGEIHRFPPAGQSLARARSELEALGFRRENELWVIEGQGVMARVLGPRPRAFVALELPEELQALDLVEREPILKLDVGLPGGWPSGGGRGQESGEVPAGAAAGAGRDVFQVGSGLSWFEGSYALADGDRQLGLDLGGLREALAAHPDGLFQLEDGTVLSLRHESVRMLAELAESAPPRESGRLSLSLATVTELLEERPGRRVEFEAGIRELVRSLRHSDALPEPVIASCLEKVLRPYQKEAVRWFGNLARWGLGGILADEMGLGKTLMALSHLFGVTSDGAPSGERAPGPQKAGSGPGSGGGPVLVVCPTSLIFNWLDECGRFFPGVAAAGLQGLGGDRREEVILQAEDLLVTSYALLRRDRDILAPRRFRAVILDEGQHIKNPESQTAQAAFALQADERWVLTGTPVENHLGELWSLFHFLIPGFLGDRAEFQERYAEPIRRGDAAPLSRLRGRVRPFILRRTKEQVLRELPPRIEQIERVAMAPAQNQLYDEYLSRARSELEGSDAARARFKVLAALTRLRQICCHPRLVLEQGRSGERAPRETSEAEEEAAGLQSGKFELLVELLDECVEEGHRVLLFSQFTSMLDVIENRLEDEAIRFCRLDGSTKNREAVVKRFQDDPGIPVFLISLKAGGYGLNLTQADTVIIYDPWWNPATEEQAAARAHRMGQELPVHVHRLITAGTVEEKVLELQASKKDLAESVLRSEEDALARLGLDDLKALLYE